MTDTSLVFAVVAGIIVIGFAGEFFFKKTGIPIFIFLILIGIIIGPILNFFPRASLISVLAPFAELTLLMVLFYSGLDLKPNAVIGKWRKSFDSSGNLRWIKLYPDWSDRHFHYELGYVAIVYLRFYDIRRNHSRASCTCLKVDENVRSNIIFPKNGS